MNIIKDPATRKISFVENGLTIQVLDEQVTANLSRERSGIIIEDRFSKRIEIVTSQIDTYQVLPAVPVKFIGKTVDLWNVLFDPSGAPLFEEQHIKFNAGAITLATKSGIVAAGAFVGPGVLTSAVVFASAFADNLYSVTVTGEDGRTWLITGKSAAGFTISAGSAAPLNGNTFWQAIKQGET